MTGPFYHGGVPGKHAGDVLTPNPPQVVDDCPICQARAQGLTMTVGVFRAMMAQRRGPTARHIVDMLADVPDDMPMDPPSAKKAVYMTTDLGYARYFAARSNHGDLYQVVPLGHTERSPEDHLPTWTAPQARVVAVVERRVQLLRRDRRALMRRWKAADRAVEVARG